MSANPELLEKLKAVAALLGGTFDDSRFTEDRTNSPRGYVVLPDGVKFFMCADQYGNKGKLSVSSSYPDHQHRADGSMYVTLQRDFSNAPHLDAINISHSKTPAQIASDIKRRFLPVYAPLYAEALAYNARQADYWKRYNELAGVAAEVLKPLNYQHATPCRVEYHAGDHVRVTVDNLDADKLRKLAAFLQTL